jgi:hypothetical protein
MPPLKKILSSYRSLLPTSGTQTADGSVSPEDSDIDEREPMAQLATPARKKAQVAFATAVMLLCLSASPHIYLFHDSPAAKSG